MVRGALGVYGTAGVSSRCNVAPGVYVVVERPPRVLLMRRMNTGYRDDQLCFPAGHIEKGVSGVRP